MLCVKFSRAPVSWHIRLGWTVSFVCACCHITCLTYCTSRVVDLCCLGLLLVSQEKVKRSKPQLPWGLRKVMKKAMAAYASQDQQGRFLLPSTPGHWAPGWERALLKTKKENVAKGHNVEEALIDRAFSK